MQASVADWRPPEFPCLDGYDELFIDLESNGLRWFDQDSMIGLALHTPGDGRSRYFPIRHKGGQNVDEPTFWRWFDTEVVNKKITNVRLKFDLHLLRKEGRDLETKGCTFGDVANYAALLDDHRRTFNQEDLVKDFLPADTPAGKVKHAHGFQLDPAKFAEYPGGLVAPRAENDVLSVYLLKQAMWPRLVEEDLLRVASIEDQIIPVVVEMEENGAPIDVETLNAWCASSLRDLEAAMWDVQRLSGCKLATPNKRDDLMKLFQTLRIELPLDPESGEPSFADDLLAPIGHPAIQRLRFASQIASLRSKFLVKYQQSVDAHGILRYELHQLPYQDTEGAGGGAVSGRFSSSAITLFNAEGKRYKFGANVQQVFGVKTQKDSFTKDYIVKKLFKPDRRKHPLAQWLDVDASQLQFRLFGHYADEPDVVDAYRNDPNADYHDVVNRLILEKAGKALSRTHTKNVNFAQVFGAGIDKMASQLGVARGVAEEISNIYHGMFPRVKPMLRLASHMAMPEHKTKDSDGDRGACGYGCRAFHQQGYRHRGYVRTYLGRRARFGKRDRHYSALNRVIQGTEGDVNKRVLIEMHKLRHELGLTPRFTVHDAWDGDIHDPADAGRVRAAFNTQYYDFKVPILWELKAGPSWGEVSQMEWPEAKAA